MIKGPSAHIHETARFRGGRDGGRETGRKRLQQCSV